MHSLDNREIDNGGGRRLSLVLAKICRQPKRVSARFMELEGSAVSVLFRAPVFLSSTQRHGLETLATESWNRFSGSLSPESTLSVFASGFNWYSMRKSALLVGRKADSFGKDLARIPMLIGRFALGPVLILWRGVNVILSRSKARRPESVRQKGTDSKPKPGLIDEGENRIPPVAVHLETYHERL